MNDIEYAIHAAKKAINVLRLADADEAGENFRKTLLRSARGYLRAAEVAVRAAERWEEVED